MEDDSPMLRPLCPGEAKCRGLQKTKALLYRGAKKVSAPRGGQVPRPAKDKSTFILAPKKFLRTAHSYENALEIEKQPEWLQNLYLCKV